MRQRRAQQASMQAWSGSIAQPNTLSPGGLPDPQAPGQPGFGGTMVSGGTVVTTSGGQVVTTSGAPIDPALLQQLSQIGMAIADQVDATPFGFGQTSVTVSPPVVIDMRAAAAQLPGGGVPGRASIRAVRDLGVAVGDQRMYELDLEVHPDGRPQYLLTHRLLVTAGAAPRLALGASLAVNVSAQVPSQLVVDWDSPWRSAMRAH